MNKPIKRRTFLTASAAMATSATVVGAVKAPAIASAKREWKMVMTWQKVLPGLGTGAIRLAKRITELSEGALAIKVFGGGELVPAMGVFDAVSQGTAQMGHTSAYYWLNKSKASAFFCAVPGGLTAQEQNGWLYFGGGKKLWDELYAQFGLIAFPAGNTGCQMGGWFNKELKTIADIKGLRMRIPGLAGEVFNHIGGSAQVIPPQDLFMSLKSGVIDALEWVGPWNDISLGFHKAAKYYYGPAFQEGGATLELMINKEAFDDLPQHLQQIIKIACATENSVMEAEYHANNIRSFQALKHKYNVDIRRYPDDILRSFFAASEDVLADVAKEGKLAKKIYDSYQQYRKEAVESSPFMELGYLYARDMAFNTQKTKKKKRK